MQECAHCGVTEETMEFGVFGTFDGDSPLADALEIEPDDEMTLCDGCYAMAEEILRQEDH